MLTTSRLVSDLTADVTDRTDAGNAVAKRPSGVHRPDEQSRRRIQSSVRLASHTLPGVQPAEVVSEVHDFLTTLKVDVEVWRDIKRANPRHAHAVLAKIDRLLRLTGSLFDDDRDPGAAVRPFPGQGSSAHRPTALTRRQREVADLIAGGLRNADIAQRLQVTSGTVANHVAHIMHRLDCRSRAQIAAWATEYRGGIPSTGRTRTGEWEAGRSAVPGPRTRMRRPPMLGVDSSGSTT